MIYNKEYNRNYQLDRYHRIRAEAISTAGGKCVVCGGIEELDFHHKDPSTKEFAISKSWSLSKERLEKELVKCELRCKYHHKKVHEPAHGTPSRYRHRRCRCDPCRLAWNKDSAARKRIWRAKLRARSQEV